MVYKSKALLSISKVFSGEDEPRTELTIRDVDGGSIVKLVVDPKDLLDAIMGLFERPCEATWINMDKLGYIIERKTELVRKGNLGSHEIDGWEHFNGYNNHHKWKRVDGVEYYECSFRRHVEKVQK